MRLIIDGVCRLQSDTIAKEFDKVLDTINDILSENGLSKLEIKSICLSENKYGDNRVLVENSEDDIWRLFNPDEF